MTLTGKRHAERQQSYADSKGLLLANAGVWTVRVKVLASAFQGWEYSDGLDQKRYGVFPFGCIAQNPSAASFVTSFR